MNIGEKQSYNFNAINTYENKKRARETFEKWKNETFINLCKYLHKLEEKYAERNEQIGTIDKIDEYFNDEDILKYYKEADKIQYYIDFFIYGTEEDILWLKKTKGKVVNL